MTALAAHYVQGMAAAAILRDYNLWCLHLFTDCSSSTVTNFRSLVKNDGVDVK
uniref:Uncharacterized protein n=1 Tax=Anguilla anguilla TaxID=7936 RepID=A0A0E9X841_ANGAN